MYYYMYYYSYMYYVIHVLKNVKKKHTNTNPFKDFSGNTLRGHPFKYVRKIFRKTNISNSLIRTHTRAYQRVTNVSFSESFAYVLNGWLFT